MRGLGWLGLAPSTSILIVYLHFPCVIVQGESIQERAEKRGTKRLKAKLSPALAKDDSPPPRKKMAKVEAAAAVKVPNYANVQEEDDESARVRTKPLKCHSRNLSHFLLSVRLVQRGEKKIPPV